MTRFYANAQRASKPEDNPEKHRNASDASSSERCTIAEFLPAFPCVSHT